MLNSDSPIIKLSHLSILRDKITILENINWQVNKGEHWVVIGGNGSGKTTLLSALTGYLTPTSGEIDLLGERYGQAHWPTLRKKIGLVMYSKLILAIVSHGEKISYLYECFSSFYSTTRHKCIVMFKKISISRIY